MSRESNQCPILIPVFRSPSMRHITAQVTRKSARPRTDYALLTLLVQRAPRNNQQPQTNGQNAILSDRSRTLTVCGVV
jgi:hypothetical protein